MATGTLPLRLYNIAKTIVDLSAVYAPRRSVGGDFRDDQRGHANSSWKLCPGLQQEEGARRIVLDRSLSSATLIEDGVHVARCLLYVDLNMVRAGVVSHPSEWRWSGCHDLSGDRERYVIVDAAALCERLNGVSVTKFKSWYMESIDEKLEKKGELEREAAWSEATAVGSAQWIDGVDDSMQVGTRERGVRGRCGHGCWVSEGTAKKTGGDSLCQRKPKRREVA